MDNSVWYSKHKSYKSLQDFPVLEKKQLIESLKDIATVAEGKGLVSFTGGTTGASLKVIYTKQDMQERFAILDSFRYQYGYILGKKTAWFSGKNIVRNKDLVKGVCYRDDFINNVRFFSTFHVAEKNFRIYWDAFNQFAPEFLVGFPSSVYELCSMAKARGLKYQGKVTCFFPTAETVLQMHRDFIGEVLGCPLVDQYASSEGAPFILQCQQGHMHLQPLTGVFEVVDENLQPSAEGELLVTSFTTHGTPLIRYRIGDRVKMTANDFQCPCGCAFPVVEKIEGRTLDYVLSPDNGKVNLGNISNSTKNIRGIICFQVVQDCLDKIMVYVVASKDFDTKEQVKFENALAERVGQKMEIDINLVADIPREKSGKFRIVKNLL